MLLELKNCTISGTEPMERFEKWCLPDQTCQVRKSRTEILVLAAKIGVSVSRQHLRRTITKTPGRTIVKNNIHEQVTTTKYWFAKKRHADWMNVPQSRDFLLMSCQNSPRSRKLRRYFPVRIIFLNQNIKNG